MVNLFKHAKACTTAFAVAAASLMTAGHATAADDTITIGYAVALTGPNATGAGISTVPNYRFWVDQVNGEGGIEMPDGSRKMIEV